MGFPTRICVVSDNLLCDFGQLRSPLWASLFLYSPPYLHHQHHLEACRGEILGVHFEHCPIRFVPTLQRTIPQAIHHAFLCTCCSPFLDTLPHLFLTVNSLSLRSSPEATSSGQASFLGIVGGLPAPFGEPHEGEDLFLAIFVHQLPTEGLAPVRQGSGNV